MRFISLGIATVFLSAASPIEGLIFRGFSPTVQAQTVSDPNTDPNSDLKTQADRLLNEGIDRYNNIDFSAALSHFEEALSLYGEINDRAGMGTTLHRIGMVYDSIQEYPQALAAYQEAVTIQREIGDRPAERVTLYRIGRTYDRLGDEEKALEFYQQASAIPPEVNDCSDRAWEGIVREGIGGIYQRRTAHRQALEFYQQALAIQGEVAECADKDLPRSYSRGSQLLENLGFVYGELGESQRALESYQQALEIVREIGDRDGQWLILNEMGVFSRQLGEYRQAIEYYQESIALQRSSMGFVEAYTFSNLGLAYDSLGEYAEAIESYQQALEIARGFDLPEDEALALNNLGTTYRKLGEYQQAIESYQQALPILRGAGDAKGESAVLNNLGAAYHSLEQYSQAIASYQQALKIAREIDENVRIGITLNNLGESYRQQGELVRAIDYYQKALKILAEVGDKAAMGKTSNNLGLAYQSVGESARAIEYFQQALAIARDIGDRAAMGTTFRNLGSLMEAQNQTELAIFFFKQSVNTREAIRENIEALPSALQQSYTATVAEDYRHLADLLLQQNRILEAQRVLDLLKVQELDDYLGNVRGNRTTTNGIPNLPPEREIQQGYDEILDRAIAIGGELAQLRQNPNRTPAEERRLAELVRSQETLLQDFNAFIDSEEIQARISQLSPQTRQPDLVNDLEDLIGLQDNLQNLEQNAVLFYPLILDDRLELILATPDSPPIRRTVNVPKEQLLATISEYRRALQRLYRPDRDIEVPAQQLYQWLIEPLENDLAAANAETLLYAPDGQLRYIPLAALHDGERWLVERYRINNITAASLMDLNIQPQTQLKVLAGAFTTGEYQLTMGEEAFNFAGLPYAGVEVALLAETVPETTQLFDRAFNPEETKPKMGDHTVLHFATHGAMVAGRPEESFILFGDGTPVTIADVRNWNLNHVDLVVLSACETGLGGNLGTGSEILGLGYQMQRAGARASIASLWVVDDGGTQALMNEFYKALQAGASKADALRQAQIAMISGEGSVWEEHQHLLASESLSEELRSQMNDRSLEHPYYWASFILIGNGL
ncbi:MAG: tetratricopeptide repeat protein [Cyanobacteriota bacterium]|nr:tetratricopeptide repeat protein [Cyanobacteriota bacterium]